MKDTTINGYIYDKDFIILDFYHIGNKLYVKYHNGKRKIIEDVSFKEYKKCLSKIDKEELDEETLLSLNKSFDDKEVYTIIHSEYELLLKAKKVTHK